MQWEQDNYRGYNERRGGILMSLKFKRLLPGPYSTLKQYDDSNGNFIDTLILNEAECKELSKLLKEKGF